MTDKQKRFCLYYVQSGNATEAAKKAGYSARTAYSQGQRMLKNVETQNFIKELSAPSDSKNIAAAQEVLEFLSDVMRDETAPMQCRLRAAENLARRLGVDKPDPEENAEKIDEIRLVIVDASGGEEDFNDPIERP